jgi:DNA-binding winged helix-turn-helix (wHTH) protein
MIEPHAASDGARRAPVQKGKVMLDQHRASRRQLVIDARPDALDALVPDIAALLARAGCPVRRVVADGPPGSAGVGKPREEGEGGLAAGDLVVVPDARIARRRGEDLRLTRIEFDLLVELLRHMNRVITKDTLLRNVWRHEPVTANAIEARVSRLRAKLERLGPRLIHTVRGVGYVLHALPDRAAGPLTILELVAVTPDAAAEITMSPAGG